MSELQRDAYPRVAASEPARSWLQLQAHLRLAPKTLDAYGRSLDDYLAFCARAGLDAARATRADVATYVRDLATRPPSHATRKPCPACAAFRRIRGERSPRPCRLGEHNGVCRVGGRGRTGP